ncbi:acyltransferase [Pseudarthrobacter oxydans]|uniref:acyltransferase family protein n=1 Tax=Pseudarthrobacter oxydans TaxID=1671 RepID=UPI0034145357
MTSGPQQSAGGSSRYKALDGLRGLAAVVVVVHHCLLVSPQLADAVDGTSGPLHLWVAWLTYSPLHLIWAGKEAVYVFFILSGFVLTLPFLRAARPRWTAYYTKRIVRIYLPAWAALVFALILAWLFPRVADRDFSSWINLHGEVLDLLRDFTLLGGAGPLNSPLWSLQWEMLFSLLLPVYLLIALRFGRLSLVSAVGMILLIGAGGALNVDSLVYLPMFGIGVLMAAWRKELQGLAEKLHRWTWCMLISSSIVLLCAKWVFPQLPGSTAMATAGGALLIFAFIAWRPALRLGTRQWAQWLGARSFSLYLIHEPIIVSVAFALDTSNAVYVFLLAVPLSLITAEVFFRYIESPSLTLAGTAGRALSKRGQPAKDTAQP